MIDIQLHQSPNGSVAAIFQVRFFVDNNAISAQTLQKCLVGVSDIYLGVSKEIHGEEKQSDIFIAAIEEGSFKVWVGAVISTLATMAAAPSVGDYTKGFISGFTGKSAEEIGESHGQRSNEILRQHIIENNSDFHLHDQDVIRKLYEADRVRFLLEADQAEALKVSRESGYSEDWILNGRRRFFEAVSKDQSIKGVNFRSDREANVIDREAFKTRTVRVYVSEEPPVEELVEGAWEHSTVSIEITSPNWDRSDDKRYWKGKLSSGKEVYFRIADSRFWKLFIDKKLKISPPDRLVGQMIFQWSNNRHKDATVLKVISFNDEPVSIPLTPTKIRELVKSYNSADEEYQIGLFGPPRLQPPV